MVFYAHSAKDIDRKRWHLLRDHLKDTGLIAASFARIFGAEKLAYLAGLLHDLGKYAPEFQKRLEGRGSKVDHSTPGAMEAVKRYGPAGIIMAYIISGHHTGLPDWGSAADESSLAARLTKELTDYTAFAGEIELPVPGEISLPALNPLTGRSFSIHFLVRFLYSCLVDADFLDTERALDTDRSRHRRRQYSLVEFRDKLDCFLDNLCAKAKDTAVNRKRVEILSDCRDKAQREPGLFTLTVPTGGGKTLASLSFALRHAVGHGKERIFYVIPYTSIIEQNAAVFRKVLGGENVLEHHSNFSFPMEDQAEAESEYSAGMWQKLRLVAENWDMPVIATTNVQFFESLFAAKSSRCRKVHNIANSVIIIDEAQMIPTGFLKPCLNALVELVTNYKATVVLCTATQPAVRKFLPVGFNTVEIIEDPSGLYQAFKRVRVTNLGAASDDELAEKLAGHHQVLCIVNSKKHARLLHEKISGEGTFHLSTRMCPAHRSETLEIIRKRLKEGLVCRVASTQLIEAGVDVDFPVVYRSLAGIDSIAQSAGRCNREGMLEIGQVYVFWPEKHGMPRGWLSRTASLGGQVLERTEDPLGLEEVKEYFTSLYDIDADQLDKEDILADIREQGGRLRFPFRSIADKFKLIEDNTSTVVIPWDEACRNALREAEFSPFPGSLTRKLQRYGVEVYDKEFKEMLAFGALEVVAGRFYVLKEEVFDCHYSRETGLRPFTDSMFFNDTFII